MVWSVDWMSLSEGSSRGLRCRAISKRDDTWLRGERSRFENATRRLAMFCACTPMVGSNWLRLSCRSPKLDKQPNGRPRRSYETASLNFTDAQFHGRRSPSLLTEQSAMRLNTSSSHACGSTSLSRAVWISV